MVKSIARQAIASRPAIARRPIVGHFGAANAQEPFNYPQGTYTFTAPRAGFWKFVAWGPGYSTLTSGDAADSGALAIITRNLRAAEKVTLVVGVSGASDTTVTFADGKVVTAGRGFGTGGTGPGVATGGDVNLNGASGAIGGNPGGAAPSSGNYLGGPGGGASGPAAAPGGGAGAGTGNGAPGMIIATFVRA